MADNRVLISQQQSKPIKVLKWKVSAGSAVSIGRVILLYDYDGAPTPEQRKLKSPQAGTIDMLLAPEGAIVGCGEPLVLLKACIHPTVMKDMCAECGADLRKEDGGTTASVPMVHSIPDLKVSEEVAQKIGKADGERLIRDRKLVLLVDLDQTLIHTTNDNIPPNIKDVYHFQLYGPNSPWYHTRLRPGTHTFLNNMAKFFELHICTFGARNYAHMIAMFLDSDQTFFSNRILSRDECFDPTSKKANLRALFPCGDNMVCIIDDREDVWNHATNLIHVKPYHFFRHTGDINAPPGLDKHEADNKEGIDLSNIQNAKLNGKVDNLKSEENYWENGFINQKEENCEKVLTNGTGEETDANVEEIPKETSESLSKTSQKDKEAEVSTNNEEQTEEKVTENETSNLDNCEVNIEKDKTNLDVKDSEESTEISNTNESENLTIETKTNVQIEESKNTQNEQDVNTHKEEEKTNEENNMSKENEIEKETEKPQTKEELKNENKMEADNKMVEANNKMLEADNKMVEANNKIVEADNKIVEANNKMVEADNKMETDKDDDLIEIEDSDDYLLYLEDILKMVHKRFYEEYDKLEAGKVPDLKVVIPCVRSEILKGTRLVFSGLVPTHIKLEQSKAYQVARSLGAIVTQDIDDDTTHLVAVRPGTAKVNAGKRRKNLKIVTPDWLWGCAERWEHIEEGMYPLNSRGSKNRHPPPHCSSPEHLASYPVHEQPAVIRKRTPSGRFMDTINPLMSFSSDDIADMDKEVEDILDDESDSDGETKTSQVKEHPVENEANTSRLESDNENDNSSSSSSDESMTGEFPRGFKRMREENTETEEKTDRDGEGDSTLDEFPSAKFRRGEDLGSDLDFGQDSNSEGSVEPQDEVDDGEWNMMGAALEREFLSNYREG